MDTQFSHVLQDKTSDNNNQKVRYYIAKNIALIFAIVFLSGCADTKEKNPQKSQDSIGNNKTSEQKYAPDYDHLVRANRLNIMLTDIASPKYISTFHQSKEGILDERKFFSNANELISKSNSDTDKAFQKLREEFRKKLISLQISEFPKMRKDYIKLLGDAVWEENMKIVGSGSGNTTITFIQADFADNNEKSDFQSSVQSILISLRFKKSIYKWIEHDDEYTYYTIDSPKDAELVQ